MEQMDLLEGRRLRDDALKQMINHSIDWHSNAVIAAVAVKSRNDVAEPFVGEDLRGPITRIIGEPHHHNCWGALMMALARLNIVKKAGTYRQAAMKSSHARVTAEYTWAR